MEKYIEAIKSGNLVEAKKHFGVIMEGRKETLRQELRVQIAEAVRAEGEEDEDGEDKEDKGDADKGKKPNPFDKKKDEGDKKPDEQE